KKFGWNAKTKKKFIVSSGKEPSSITAEVPGEPGLTVWFCSRTGGCLEQWLNKIQDSLEPDEKPKYEIYDERYETNLTKEGARVTSGPSGKRKEGMKRVGPYRP
ncbi:MAG: hypothetical protein ACRDF4_06470, partial [Rhabdochlamydiaceae bacterium]